MTDTQGDDHAPPSKTGQRFARGLDWNLLKAFHEIAQAGGVSRAARELSRKQPAVSLSLKRLEDHLGVTLCRRGPGGFDLTDEGELVAEICGSMAGLVSGMPNRVADIAEDLHGRVRIQVISNLVDDKLDAAIERFHLRHPRVELFVRVVTWDVVSRALLRNEVDVGIAPAHHMRPDLDYDPLFREIHRPYCGRAHPLYGKTFATPAELASEGFILTGADEPDELTQFRTRHGLGRHIAGLSEHLEEARRLAVLGVGICYLPEAFAAP